MQIEKDSQTYPAATVVKPAKPQPAAAGSATCSFEEFHRLNQAMLATSGVRTAAVARAKAWLADPEFPSLKQMENVAELFAKHLSDEKAIW